MQYPHQLTFDPDKQTALFCKEENIESERRFIYYTEKVHRVQNFFIAIFRPLSQMSLLQHLSMSIT